MIKTGTFLEMWIKTPDTTPIPVILGETTRGYFVCLPNHDAAFELKYDDTAESYNFTDYMDGTSAELVAATVNQAIGLLLYCKGGQIEYNPERTKGTRIMDSIKRQVFGMED
jgi:hypothetical protein